MVRTGPIIASLILLLGCQDVQFGISNQAPIAVTGGVTTMLTQSGLDIINEKTNQEVLLQFGEGVALGVPSPSVIGKSFETNSPVSKVYLEGLSIELAEKETHRVVPISCTLQTIQWETTHTFESEGESHSCPITLSLSDIELTFSMRASNVTVSGNYSFLIEDNTGTGELGLEYDGCAPPSFEGNEEEWNASLEASLLPWRDSTLSTLSEGISLVLVSAIQKNLGVDIEFSGQADTIRANNATSSLFFSFRPGKAADAFTNRGGWIAFDIDLNLESDLHPCAPGLSVPEDTFPSHLQAGDFWPDPLSAPFDYAFTVHRTTIREFIRHAIRSGRFCPREHPLGEEETQLLRTAIPALNSLTSVGPLSLNLQTFSLPEVHFQNEKSDVKIQILFPHMRVDINQVIEGVSIRLLTLDAPISFGVQLKVDEDLSVRVDFVDASTTQGIIRSPLWPNLAGAQAIQDTLATVLGQSLIPGDLVGFIPEPLGLKLSPNPAYSVGLDHLVFPFGLSPE